ncbi:MAG: hypothetical protein AAF830_06015 [Pseudomonadota bacterium]
MATVACRDETEDVASIIEFAQARSDDAFWSDPLVCLALFELNFSAQSQRQLAKETIDVYQRLLALAKLHAAVSVELEDKAPSLDGSLLQVREQASGMASVVVSRLRSEGGDHVDAEKSINVLRSCLTEQRFAREAAYREAKQIWGSDSVERTTGLDDKMVSALTRAAEGPSL